MTLIPISSAEPSYIFTCPNPPAPYYIEPGLNELTLKASFDFSPLLSFGSLANIKYLTFDYDVTTHDTSGFAGVLFQIIFSSGTTTFWPWTIGTHIADTTTAGGLHYYYTYTNFDLPTDFTDQTAGVTATERVPTNIPTIQGTLPSYSASCFVAASIGNPDEITLYSSCAGFTTDVAKFTFSAVCDFQSTSRFGPSYPMFGHSSQRPVVTIRNLVAWCETQNAPCTPVIGPPPPPSGETGTGAGIDLLAWKEGYHVAEAASLLKVSTKWHHDMRAFDTTVTVDSASDCHLPCLSHAKHLPPLGLVYTRPGGIYRKESMDYGRTWKSDPAEGQAFKGGGVKHCREVYNERTGQRVLVYNDATDKNADNTLSGKGKMQAAIYGAETDAQTGRLLLKGTHQISDLLADDASFGLLYVEDDGAIDCVFYAAGTRRIFRSYDDGASWKDIT